MTEGNPRFRSNAKRFSDKHPKAVKLKGMSAATLMAEANAADRKAREIKNAETIRRWLREGAPGLVYDLSID